MVIQKAQTSGDVSFDLTPLQKKSKEPNNLAKKGSAYNLRIPEYPDVEGTPKDL